MIRPLTLLTLLAAGGAGLHLYQVKHSVSLLDKELRDIRGQTEAARARTGILRAEWQLLNDPERLRRNVQALLPLDTMQPAQFIRMQDLDRRLPQAVAFNGAPSLFAARPPADAEVAVAAAEPAPAVAVAAAAPVRPAAPVEVPALVAAAAAAPAPRERPPAETPVAAARRPAPRAAEPAAVASVAPRAPAPRAEPVHQEVPRLAEPRPVAPPRVLAVSRPAPAPRPAPAEVAQAQLPPLPAPRPPQPLYRPAVIAASPAPSYAAPAPAPVAPAASALGGARGFLAPPVPIASASAATLSPGYATR
ncbi:hypothetical protein [Roseomonas sp. BN140053]|uniref:cell division protein FtsL n=1 Tax=Roseomonas sp. BN140053 TaxID=3391898 RepID=UPI0039E9E86D